MDSFRQSGDLKHESCLIYGHRYARLRRDPPTLTATGMAFPALASDGTVALIWRTPGNDPGGIMATTVAALPSINTEMGAAESTPVPAHRTELLAGLVTPKPVI